MRRIGFFAALLAIACHAASAGAQQTSPRGAGADGDLLRVIVDGKYGYIDRTGRMVIQPTFDIGWQFSEGLAAASLKGRVGFIDRTGSFVIAPRFDYAREFHEGLAEVRMGKLWGFVRTDGELAVEPRFVETRWFSDGRALVTVDGRWGYIDTAGVLVIPARYRQATLFENGRAFVQVDDRWLAIDRYGEPRYDPDDLMVNERAGKYGFITPDGKVAIDFRFDGVQAFSEGLAAVRIGDRWGFIDRGGHLVIPAQFEDRYPPSQREPIAGPPIGSFKEGLAAVYQDGSWRFIDARGQEAFPGRFPQVSNSGFQNGVVQVCGSKTCGYIDRTGRVIWPWD